MSKEVEKQRLTVEDCEKLNEMVAVLYTEVIHQGRAQDAMRKFLADLKILLDFEKGEIYFCKEVAGAITYEDFIFCGWTQEELDKYHNEEVYKMDEVLPIVSNSNPIIFKSSDFFVQSAREKTKYYQEVVQPLGMRYSVEGNIYYENGELGAISIHRSDGNRDFTVRTIEAIRFVRPHLAIIAKVYNQRRCRETEIFDQSKDRVFHEIFPDMPKAVSDILMEVRKKYNLSPRETDVLVCVIEGLQTVEISDKLYISITTAKKHLINLYKKMGINGRHQILGILLGYVKDE